MEQKTSVLATLSILGAVVSYILTFSGYRVTGLLFALGAIPLGVIGLVMAASPRTGGGLISIIAIVLAVFAIGIAVLAMLGRFVF